MEIKDCYQEYKDKFLDDEGWFPLDENEEDKVKNAYEKINSFVEKSFIYLTRSIISGEYIKVPNINDVLSDFINEVYFLEYDPSLGGSINSITKLKVELEILNSSLYNALRYYQHFISTSKNKFMPTPISEQYGVFKVMDGVKDNALSIFVNITIPLCKYDYYLPVSKKEFQNLLYIRNNLKELIEGNNLEVKKMCSLLLFKCHFIMRRIKTTHFDNQINFNRETINPSILSIGDYESFIPKETITKEQLCDEIRSPFPKIKSFVFLMKYYKQNLEKECDIVLMNSLIERYIEVYDEFKGSIFRNNDEFKTQYDQFSFDSVLNFLHNCRFSFFTQKCNPNLKNIKLELRKIEEVQFVTGVKNFHPYEKSIEAIILCINTHIQENNFDEKLLNDKIDELERLIVSFDDSLKWSEFHKFFPFQLPFEESLVYSEEYDLNLFVPSAFAKNIDYQELKEELNSFKKERDNLKFLLVLSKERREIEEMKESIKNSDKNAYDLIAIFTAAITFLFGIVNIFINNTTLNLYQLIANTMGFGILLLLFASLYLFISPLLIQRIRWKQYCKTGRFIVGIIFLSVYVTLVFALSKNSQSVLDKVDKTEFITEDSLHNELRLDVQQIKAAP